MVMSGTVPPSYFRDADKFSEPDAPVTLEAEFSTEENQYSYGVSYRGNTCVEEWLYSTVKPTPVCVFERKLDDKTGKIRINMKVGKREEAKNEVEIKVLPPGSLCDDYEAHTPMRRWMLVGLLEDHIRSVDEVWVYYNDIYTNSWWTLAEMVMVAYINHDRAEKDKVKLLIYDASKTPVPTQWDRRRCGRLTV